MIKTHLSVITILVELLSHLIGSEPKEYNTEQKLPYGILIFVYPLVRGAIENATIDSFIDNAFSLFETWCKKLRVCLGKKDPLTVREILYVESVKKVGGMVKWR